MTITATIIGLVFIVNTLIFYFLWRRNKTKITHAKLRVSKGRRSLIGLSIRNAEKKMASNQNLSPDINNKRKELEISHNFLLMRNQNLLSLAELTRLMDLKLKLLEKHTTELRIPKASTNAHRKTLTNDKKVKGNGSEMQFVKPKRQREDIENELFNKINQLNKNR